MGGGGGGKPVKKLTSKEKLKIDGAGEGGRVLIDLLLYDLLHWFNSALYY